MGINTPNDDEAELQIGPTNEGMVRLFVTCGDAEISMDFSPEDTETIADELRAAAVYAREDGKE